jgi:hypothetical protein
VSWAREALTAIGQIILIEHRMDTLTEQDKPIAVTCHDLDRRFRWYRSEIRTPRANGHPVAWLTARQI